MQIKVVCHITSKKATENGYILKKFFGSFGLSTKGPYTIMLCLLCIIVVGIGIVICAHLPLAHGYTETSYLVYICTYASIYAHEVFNDSDL